MAASANDHCDEREGQIKTEKTALVQVSQSINQWFKVGKSF